ncbi:MAG: hypothetical protein AAF411_29620 [Myxococcota bacterium]
MKALLARWTLYLRALLLVFVVAGCGAAQRARVNEGVQEALSLTTDVVDPAYELAVTSCDGAEAISIARHAPDEGDEAAEEIRRIRRECDSIFEGFDTLRELQATARVTGDAYEAGREDYAKLLAAVGAAREFAAGIKARVSRFRERYGVRDGGES